MEELVQLVHLLLDPLVAKLALELKIASLNSYLGSGTVRKIVINNVPVAVYTFPVTAIVVTLGDVRTWLDVFAHTPEPCTERGAWFANNFPHSLDSFIDFGGVWVFRADHHCGLELRHLPAAKWIICNEVVVRVDSTLGAFPVHVN